jgi:anaerobic selenocysteine-containing dehydrogenase
LCRSEIAIICDLGARLADAGRPGPTPAQWRAMGADYDVIRDHASRVVPGCEDLNTKVRQKGGFLLPHPPRDSRTFDTPSKRALFSVSPMGVLDVPEGHLLLQSLRSHDQFNTTIYGHDDRYRGLSGSRDIVMVHPDDIAALGLQVGQVVDLVHSSEDGSVRVVTGFRLVAYPTPRGCAAAYYPEVNNLVALDSTARGSNCPTSKSVVIQVLPTDSSRRSVIVDATAGVGSDDHHKSQVQPRHLS